MGRGNAPGEQAGKREGKVSRLNIFVVHYVSMNIT